MFNQIKTAALSALVGLGTLGAIPAHADSLYLGFGNNQDPRFGVYTGDDDYGRRDWRRDRDWREPGCSMCLAMNDDRLKPHERCASTSNRNFEGRQGFKGRTHLVSPAMAAAAAIAGHFVDIRDWK